MIYLLDTCAISELVAPHPNPNVVDWIDGIDEDRLFLSGITIGEVKKGIEKLADSERRPALREWLEDDLLPRFSDRILPIDIAVMLVWGKLASDLEKRGRPMPAIDSLIAATCLYGGLGLVTRNENDFDHSGVEIVNPWSGTRPS
jgi:tRNA(fMet)-specific endonuclease VapC